MNKILLAVLVLLSACTVQKIKKSVRDSEIFKQGFTGFVLFDPEKDKVLYAMNEDKYFTPASNTKMFTFYVAYKVLGDRVNSLNYLEREDSLIFWGTGDPALLHPDFKDASVLNLLGSTDKKLYLADNFSTVTAYGPGWSWNWYNYYFGPDRSALPVYGNIIRFRKNPTENRIHFTPKFFASQIHSSHGLHTNDYRIQRKKNTNDFKYTINGDSVHFVTDRPFVTSCKLAKELLEDTLKKEISVIGFDTVKALPHEVQKGIETDSLYKQMLKISDNFLAEQLLVLVSDELFDSLDLRGAIQYAKENYLADLSDEPNWVDGSGLSSYNKFTPRSIIDLLKKIKEEVPEEKIYAYFPSGGKSGTIRSWYKSDDERPYVYAKTGTLNGVICLSGYLLTKGGKELYFSFMHNNYVISSNKLKSEMENVLYRIYQDY